MAVEPCPAPLPGLDAGASGVVAVADRTGTRHRPGPPPARRPFGRPLVRRVRLPGFFGPTHFPGPGAPPGDRVARGAGLARVAAPGTHSRMGHRQRRDCLGPGPRPAGLPGPGFGSVTRRNQTGPKQCPAITVEECPFYAGRLASPVARRHFRPDPRKSALRHAPRPAPAISRRASGAPSCIGRPCPGDPGDPDPGRAGTPTRTSAYPAAAGARRGSGGICRKIVERAGWGSANTLVDLPGLPRTCLASR